MTVALQFADVDSEDDVIVGGTVDGILISRDMALADTEVSIILQSFQVHSHSMVWSAVHYGSFFIAEPEPEPHCNNPIATSAIKVDG